jgi:uncharacterized membrane-anchored protein YjiN (DUF445 family)
MPEGVMTLASLALLKARYDVERKDVLDTLIPFVENSISKRAVGEFSAEELKQWLQEDFGLAIPLHAITLVSNRMVKRGGLRKETGRFFVVNVLSDADAFEKFRIENQAHLNATVEGGGLCVNIDWKRKRNRQ